ncbi:hypothetical protein GOP47_0029509 [Adiantum capillus-veneris]|nr:hypothetical protein GOP47_0029509 [Adiantum capillus-veneris]
MTSGSRAPTSKERENNKRRERKRRAIAARIFAGLRQYGNYKLPKHCDNNEVLKALCREAGWIVEEDGTTYKPGCKPVQDRGDCCISSSTSPASSSFVQGGGAGDGLSLIPWLKGLSSSCVTVASTPGGVGNASAAAPSSRNPGLPPLQIMRGGTCSAPVTPPLSSPRMTSHVQPDWTELSIKAGEALSSDCAATALSNAYHGHPPFIASTAASGTSTPTYPPVFIMSGTSTPSHFMASGSATPFLPSGASTPTYASSMRGMPTFNFAAVAAMAAVQQQQQAQDRDQILPTGIPLESERPRDACKPSTNMDVDMDWRAAMMASRQPGGVKHDDTAKELRRDLSAASAVRMDHVGNGDTSLVMDVRREAFTARGAAPSSDMLGVQGDRYTIDQSRVCSWPPPQSQGEGVGHTIFALAVPDARGIVPENFRAVPDVDSGVFTFKAKNRQLSGIVKPWEGETIHEVSLEEEGLKLTLGNASTMAATSAPGVAISTIFTESVVHVQIPTCSWEAEKPLIRLLLWLHCSGFGSG